MVLERASFVETDAGASGLHDNRGRLSRERRVFWSSEMLARTLRRTREKRRAAQGPLFGAVEVETLHATSLPRILGTEDLEGVTRFIASPAWIREKRRRSLSPVEVNLATHPALNLVPPVPRWNAACDAPASRF